MTGRQVRFCVSTEDGKQSIQVMDDGAVEILRGTHPAGVPTILEIELLRQLEDTQAKLVEIDANEVLPIETAKKDGRMLQLLVRYDRDSDDDHPLADEDWNRPGWTIGFNTLGDTGEDKWHLAGWNWYQDHFTEGRGTPVGWLPFHFSYEDEPVAGFLSDVIAERIRQITVEGFTPEHDDRYQNGDLADAGACYAIYSGMKSAPPFWPWNTSWWKPKDRRRDLVRATALLIAEGERLDRKDERPPSPQTLVAKNVSPSPVTVAELLARGMDERMAEIVSLLAGEILRDPVTKSLSPDELAAFGFGPTCPCGERGLRPGEKLTGDGESCEECRAAEPSALVGGKANRP